MGKLTDPEILACYRNALANWRYEGYIIFTDRAADGMRAYLPNWKHRDFGGQLFQFVTQQNGEIDQVVETREGWRELWSHHFDLRPLVDGVKMYVETRLKYANASDPDDPVILVVNVHPV